MEKYTKSNSSRMHVNKVRFAISLVIILVVLCVATALVAAFCSSIRKDAENKERRLNSTNNEQPKSDNANENNNVAPEEPKAKTGEGLTILINAKNPIPDNYVQLKMVDLMGNVPVRDGDVKAASVIIKPLKEMMNDAESSGASGLYVTSAYRSKKLQKKIYNESEDKSYVQPPGHSEHQTGLAVDMAKNGIPMNDLGKHQEGTWLYQNSWRYGFIIRYPADKVNITGISYEPWHLRYVGKDVAKVCHDENLCLEEYIEKHT